MKKLGILLILVLFAFGASGATGSFTIDTANTTGTLLKPPNIDVPGVVKVRGSIQYVWATVPASDLDWSLSTSYFKQLTANTTFTFSGMVDNFDGVLMVQQDGTGNRTVTLPASIVYINSTNQVTAIAANTNASFYSIFHIFRRSGVVFCEGVSTASSKFSVDFDSGTATVANLQAQLSDGTTLATTGTAQALTSKTIDSANNIIKLKGYLVLTHPHNVDGVGAILQTNDTTASVFGQALFSNSAASTANFIEYRIVVPEDIDTTVDLVVERWKFRLGGADTSTHQYIISMQQVADSASYTGTPGNAVNLNFGSGGTGDASGANGDVETVSGTTLTGWRSALTAGQLWVIRVARNGNNASDASTIDSYSGPLVISYGIVQ